MSKPLTELQRAWAALGVALADRDQRAIEFWRRRIRELAAARRDGAVPAQTFGARA